MKPYKTITLLVFALLAFAPAYAQMGGGMGQHGGDHSGGSGQHGGGMMNGDDHGGNMGEGMMNGGWCVDPDSLTEITVTGTVIVDASSMMDMYYLDVDGDGQADYHLSFGPYWYEPDSSDAVRPAAGDVVTVTGGLHESGMHDFPAIVVYEINGAFWRDPFAPRWNWMGGPMHRNGWGRHGDFGFHFGMHHDSLATITLAGSVLVDSTLMAHYYLDKDGDGTPDYYLNFGPYWYVPESGAVRPSAGDNITVVGGLIQSEHMAVLIVYELNGLVWRDSTSIGGHIGGWIGGDMHGFRRIHSPFDNRDWMEFQPGWRNTGGGQHGGGMNFPDSIFCQMWEVLPENVPGAGNGQHIAAYQIDIYAPNGSHMMMSQNGRRGSMGFGSAVRLQLHYTDSQMQMFGGDESQLMAHYWDEEVNDWAVVNDAVVDAENNTVSFASTQVSSFVALSAAQTTTLVASSNAPVNFVLEQNYPNPFNPQTTIAFSLEKDAHVTLSIYNVIGQLVATLVDENLAAGAYQRIWNAAAMTSGVYFYELRIGSQGTLKKMNLVK